MRWGCDWPRPRTPYSPFGEGTPQQKEAKKVRAHVSRRVGFCEIEFDAFRGFVSRVSLWHET